MKLGTRGSELALFQAHAVADLLRLRAGVDCDIVVIKTSGDRLAQANLSEIGGKRLFVKEIEDGLLAGDIDLAVHSSKDMPAVLPEGLEIGAVLPREDPSDAIVLPASGPEDAAQPAESLSLDAVVRRLGRAPRIGTSSVRRIAQLARVFPGATFQPVRGNVGTRLRKLDAGEFDALVLASAGLRRLGRGSRVSARLPVEACVPAPGQGIIAVEIRSHDDRVRTHMAAIDDPDSRAALRAERAVVTRLGGGCQMPIGAYAEVLNETMTVTAIVVSTDGARAARAEASGASENAAAIGVDVAEQLLKSGAGEILGDVLRTQAAVEGIQP
jgi:hydroxymethylbilane synthase